MPDLSSPVRAVAMRSRIRRLGLIAMAIAGGCGGSPSVGPVDLGRMPPPGAKRVFLTSDSFPNGDLITAGGDKHSGGVINGDHLCAIAAGRTGLDGTWRAWISQGGGVDAIDRVGDVGPWYRLDGEVVFNDRAGLLADARVPIDVTEDGRRAVACGHCSQVVALTGTKAGRDAVSSCNDWQGGGAGIGGLPLSATKMDWSSGWSGGCNSNAADYRLYCFEQ